jgi:hypothetical protein
MDQIIENPTVMDAHGTFKYISTICPRHFMNLEDSPVCPSLGTLTKVSSHRSDFWCVYVRTVCSLTQGGCDTLGG